MIPRVIDLYHLDPVTSFQQVKGAGIVAVIHKASEGQSHADSAYAARRKAFTDIGLKWGAYHFFHGNGHAEADYFLSVSEPDDNTVVALDWETTADGYTPTSTQARAFLERIEEKLGRKAEIYSGNVAKEQLHGRNAYFGSHRLWLAQYASHWKTQESWDKPWLWQYGSEITHSKIPGIGSYCDVNDILDVPVADFLASWVEDSSSPPVEGFEQVGVASWYSDSTNASGAPVDNAHDMTVAHKTLPFGTKLEIWRTDLPAPQPIVVTVQDRGPYEPGRIVDLRPAAARALGLIDIGVAPVKIRTVS